MVLDLGLWYYHPYPAWYRLYILLYFGQASKVLFLLAASYIMKLISLTLTCAPPERTA